MEIYLESAVFILILTTFSVSGNLFCGENERFSICGNNECRATCKLPLGPPSCDPKCRPGCICLKGLVKRERDNTCVKIEECFKSPSSRNFLQRRPGCPPKKKQIPLKCPHIRQRRGPPCRRRFPQKGPDDDKEPQNLSDFPLEAEDDNKKTEQKKKLQKEYEKALNNLKDAIEKGKGLMDDATKKLKEVRKKMKKNNVKIEKKGKDLLKQIKKKAKDAEKNILDKITEENKEHTSHLVSGRADYTISIHIWQKNRNANR